MMIMILTILIGMIAGLLSGLLGIGGGTVLIPMLTFFLGLSQHLAQGISMVFIIPTAIAGLVQFYKEKLLDLRVAALLAIGAIIGALISSSFVHLIPGDDLKKLFGCFVIFTGIRMIWIKPKS